MGCRYSNFDGKCNVFDENIEDELGCDDDGFCICEDDEDPSELCSNYDSEDDDTTEEDEDDE